MVPGRGATFCILLTQKCIVLVGMFVCNTYRIPPMRVPPGFFKCGFLVHDFKDYDSDT